MDGLSAPSKLREVGVHMGKVIIECDHRLSVQQRQQVSQYLAASFPGGAVILEGGMRISHSEQLDRIEAKLDALIDALADESEQDEGVEIRTMDGQTHVVSSRCSTL